MASTPFLTATFHEDYDPTSSAARHPPSKSLPLSSAAHSSDALLQSLADPFLTLVENWVDAMDEYPLVFACLQYWALTAHALAMLLWNSTLTVAQSFAWIATAEGLQWIQTSGADSSDLDWEVLLLGSVFLLLDIDIESIDPKRYPALLSTAGAPPKSTETSPLHRQVPQKKTSTSSSSVMSSSSTNTASSKRVTFHNRVMVIGGADACGKTVSRLSIDTDRIVPAAPLTESPTRSTFSLDEADSQEFQSDLFSPSTSCSSSFQGPSPTLSDLGASFRSSSPCPSVSSSCRSSICSEMSDCSSIASYDSLSDQRTHQRTKKSKTSKIASFFHKQEKHKQSHQRATVVLQAMDLGECASCPPLYMPSMPEDHQYQPTLRRSSVLHKLGMRLRRPS